MMNGAHAMERCRRSSAEGGWRPNAAVWLRGEGGRGEEGGGGSRERAAGGGTSVG
jgi:hypothetical protein